MSNHKKMGRSNVLFMAKLVTLMCVTYDQMGRANVGRPIPY